MTLAAIGAEIITHEADQYIENSQRSSKAINPGPGQMIQLDWTIDTLESSVSIIIYYLFIILKTTLHKKDVAHHISGC